MAEKVAIKVPPEWKENLIALRDTLPEAVSTSLIAALASRTPQELEQLVTTLTQPGGLPPAPVATLSLDAGIPASKTATVTSEAGIPASETAPTVAIILRNDALMATTIAGKRYIVDAKIQVTPQELEVIEAELSQRPQRWGNYTRIERVQPA